MKKNNILKLIIAIAVSEMAGVVGSLFTAPSLAPWYVHLVKPAQSPPSWVFGPVWTFLFAGMGVAAFFIWKKGLSHRNVRVALGIFIAQLLLNTLWSVIFFGFHSIGGALIEIIFLWISILVTMIVFSKISKVATLFLVPYILWVSFAIYLNYALWMLN